MNENGDDIDSNRERNESIINGCLMVPVLFVIYYILFGKIYGFIYTEPKEGYGMFFFLFTNPILSLFSSIITVVIFYSRKKFLKK